MKGLLLKDFYLVRAALVLILVTYAVIGVGMSIVVDPWITVIIGAVMFGIMSASTINMDKQFGWRKLAATLPVKKETTVDSKYLLYLIVSVLGFVPHLFTNPWGTLMAVLVALALSVPASLIYKKNKTRKGALIGIIVGAVVALAVAIVGNIIVTPFYAHMTTAQVVALIVPALLPFNALKFTIHGVVTFLIYKPISNLLNR